jgi:hypothetical protein
MIDITSAKCCWCCNCKLIMICFLQRKRYLTRSFFLDSRFDEQYDDERHGRRRSRTRLGLYVATRRLSKTVQRNFYFFIFCNHSLLLLIFNRFDDLGVGETYSSGVQHRRATARLSLSSAAFATAIARLSTRRLDQSAHAAADAFQTIFRY